ncbi:TetR/AcrR family transcriptional regulator, partial [bacterium]
MSSNGVTGDLDCRRCARAGAWPMPRSSSVKRKPLSPFTPVRKTRRGNYDEKRDALLRTAARLFVTEGFHNTSLTRLAESLGVTKPTLYYYLKDKDDILFQCLEIAANRVIGWLDDALRSEASGLESVTAFLQKYIAAVIDDYVRCFILVEEAALAASSLRRIRARKRQINQRLTDLIQRGAD